MLKNILSLFRLLVPGLYDVSFDSQGNPQLEIDFDGKTAAFHASISYCGSAILE